MQNLLAVVLVTTSGLLLDPRLPSTPRCARGSPAIGGIDGGVAMQAPPDVAPAAPSCRKTASDDSNHGVAGLGLGWPPGAVKASKCGAINNQIVKTTDAEAVLKLTVKHHDMLNSVNTQQPSTASLAT